MIERVRIQGYKSLHDVDVKLEPLTVLIGRSGTGKSNFVRALAELSRRLDPSRFDGADPARERGTSPPPGGRAATKTSYDIHLVVDGVGPVEYRIRLGPGVVGGAALDGEELTVDGRCVFRYRSDESVEPSLAAELGAPHFRGQLLSSRRDDPSVAPVLGSLTDGLAVYDFGNAVLQFGGALQGGGPYPVPVETWYEVAEHIARDERAGDWQQVVKGLKAVSPNFIQLELGGPIGWERQVVVEHEVGGGMSVLNAVADESEGFRRYLAHMLALYQTPPKQTMLFEHPEGGIHPGTLHALASEFRRHVAEGRGQVILTTHSPQFLDQFDAENVRAVVMEDGRTRIGKVAEDQFEAVRTSLMSAGDLLTIDPARLDEPAPVAAGA